MAKIAQLIEGNYNILDNIPVINQDLTASGFTPVANTYYRHTGATTDTFTQGVIYYYDGTEHKALDGSGGSSGGGGTTLNKYTWILDLKQTVVASDIIRLKNILLSAKGRVMGSILVNDSYHSLQPSESSVVSLYGASISYYNDEYHFKYFYVMPINEYAFSVTGYEVLSSTNGQTYNRDNNNPSSTPFKELKVVYYNDTEIT